MNASSRCGIDLTPEVASDGTITASSGESVSTSVINAVADARGVDPLDLDPLHDAVDPDALDALFSEAGESSTLKVGFTVAGCEVVVRGAGDVSVTAPARRSDAGAAAACGD